jgi:hypothetical protein
MQQRQQKNRNSSSNCYNDSIFVPPRRDDSFVIELGLSYIKNPVVRLAYPQIGLKELVHITHDDFIVGYQSGRLGCSVNVLRVFSLVYSTKVHEKRVVTEVLTWSIGILVLICLWVSGILFLPLPWALTAGVLITAIFCLIALHRVGDAVIAAALSDNAFYEMALEHHAFGCATDGEGNLPRLNKVVPMRDPRQARRR